MYRPRSLAQAILILQFFSCRSSQSAEDKQRNVSRAPDKPADTAAQRADSQFQTCLYVYNSEEKLRECLVLTQKWPVEDAARRIAQYQAEISRIADSLRAIRDSIEQTERRVQDSVSAVRAKYEDSVRRARIRARLRLEDSLERSRDLLDGPIAETLPDSGPWMGDDRTGAYYRTTCAAAKRIPVDHRIYFPAENWAQSAHMWRSKQPGC